MKITNSCNILPIILTTEFVGSEVRKIQNKEYRCSGMVKELINKQRNSGDMTLNNHPDVSL